MAGIIGLVNLLGSPAADRLATGIGAEKDQGTPEGRITVIVIRDDAHVSGRVGVATTANKGDGSVLQEIGSTGVFTAIAEGDVNGIAESVRNSYAAAGAPVPGNWSTGANAAAALGAHGGDVAPFDQNAKSGALNLTIRQWASSTSLLTLPPWTLATGHFAQ